MDLVGTAVGNPLNEDDLKEDSDAVLAPDLLLVRVYGGKLMQLGPFMPPLLVLCALSNGYRRNSEVFMPPARPDFAMPQMGKAERHYYYYNYYPPWVCPSSPVS